MVKITAMLGKNVVHSRDLHHIQASTNLILVINWKCVFIFVVLVFF